MKNHAVVMARFAVNCMSKTSQLTNELVATLGLETADLGLRIGLNSGPTTGGGTSCCVVVMSDHQHVHPPYGIMYI
jgi:hypothetical protein